MMPHLVQNQPPPLADYNLWQANPALREAVRREGAGWADAALDEYGAQ
ncbi:MAG TPA: acyl-CoA dehydrogenase, partial [Lautropia sp.]|nr:acyl-CoA dehydrogenase [Lautropia sp.]